MAAAKKVSTRIKKSVALSMYNGVVTLQDLQDFITEAKALGIPMETNLTEDYDGESLQVSTP